MKNLTTITALLVFSGLATSPIVAQELSWLSHFGSNGAGGNQSGFGMSMGEEGSIYLAGEMGHMGIVMDAFSLSPEGDGDLLIAKLDSTGATVWAVSATNNCFNDIGESGRLLFDTISGQVFVTGLMLGTTTFGTQVVTGHCSNQFELFLAAYDTEGNCTWARGGTGYNVRPTALLLGAAGTVYMFGTNLLGTATFSGPPPITAPDGAFVVEYDANGTPLSVDRIMSAGSITNAALIDNDWVVCGRYYADDSLWATPLPDPMADVGSFLARTSPAGVIQWVTTVGSDANVSLPKCAVLASGKTLVTGISYGATYFDTDTLPGTPGYRSGFVACYDQNGVFDWAVPVTDTTLFFGLDLAIGPDQTFYINGTFSGTLSVGEAVLSSDASKEHFIVHLDTMGQVLGAVRLGRAAFPSGSILANEHGIYVAGAYDSTMVYGPVVIPVGSEGSPDLFVAKFQDIEGFTGIQRNAAISETLHIYANPTNGICTIELPQSLRFTNELVLSVFDNTGQLVQRVPLTTGAAGIKLDIRAQAKGMYHVELGDGQQRYSGSVVFE